LLWLRPDLAREQARAYWAGPHGQLVARIPGFLEYRQHHFSAEGPGAWPALDGVETAISDERRVDGMPEVTFEHPWSPLLGGKKNREVHQDERNVFARTILHVTGPSGGRWFKSGYDARPEARVAILIRRRDGVSRKHFKKFVQDELGPALDRAEGVVELRTQTFLPFSKRLWNTPDVAHDYPANQQFHAAIVLAATDRAPMARLLDQVSAQQSPQLRKHCSAIHAYDVEQTYLYRRDGRRT
jgi:hypothetical protein